MATPEAATATILSRIGAAVVGAACGSLALWLSLHNLVQWKWNGWMFWSFSLLLLTTLFRIVLLVRSAGRSLEESGRHTGDVERWLAGWGRVLRTRLCRAACHHAKIQSRAATRDTAHRSARVCRGSVGHDCV